LQKVEHHIPEKTTHNPNFGKLSTWKKKEQSVYIIVFQYIDYPLKTEKGREFAKPGPRN
jgi:hypothetical protein